MLVEIPFLMEILYYWKTSPEQCCLLPQKNMLVLKIAPAEDSLNCLEMIVCHSGHLPVYFISHAHISQQKHNLLFSSFLNLKILSSLEANKNNN